MQVVQRFGHLIEDEFAVPLCKYIFTNEGVQVDIHMFEYQVNISIILRPDNLFELDDVGVGQFHEEHDFSVSSLGICRVIKSIKIFLEGFHLLGPLVCHLPDMPVGTTADFLMDFELRQHMSLYLLAHNIIYIEILLSKGKYNLEYCFIRPFTVQFTWTEWMDINRSIYNIISYTS